MSEKIRVGNIVDGNVCLPNFLLLLPICLPFTMQSKRSWGLFKMQWLNVLQSLPITPLLSFQGSSGSLALVIISPIRFFVQLKEGNHMGQGMCFYFQ